jgi:hypothetical protein
MRIGTARLISCALLLALCGPAMAQKAAQVGWIEKFDGRAADYGVMRVREQHPPECCWTPLYVGDRVIVHRESGRIYLHFGGGRSVVVCRKKTSAAGCEEGSPYAVGAAQDTGLAASLVGWVGDWLTGWWADRPTERERQTRIRGGEIIVPLLDTRQVRVLAGERALRLAWQGGGPPYRLVIYRQGVIEPLVLRENIPEPRFGENFAFEPDVYSLELRDSRGLSWRKSIIVLPVEAVPAPPGMALEGLPREMRETLLAAWLASQDEGAWTWEAYLRVTALPENYTPAAALRDALESGRRPAPPQ